MTLVVCVYHNGARQLVAVCVWQGRIGGEAVE